MSELDIKVDIIDPKARLIAFYLPQFHPIPENDQWWGKGFTEWSNVAKAKPLFKGHLQPKLPTDLGFYDLRVPETREAQAELAKQYGVEGFCYWHYWFGGGKRLLERPFSEVLESGKPDFPFCLGWANQTWTGVWHGAPNRILIEQTYPGKEDFKKHFYSLLPSFTDPRYLHVNGLPLFIVYAPKDLPEPKRFTECWRELAIKEGLPGLHLLGVSNRQWHPEEHGFDSGTFHLPFKRKSTVDGWRKRLFIAQKPEIVSYEELISRFGYEANLDSRYFPTVIPQWDNTPRSGINGVVLKGASPELFGKHLSEAIKSVIKRPLERRIIFIKSWNEWAEGNYIEPDLEHGHGYLEVIKSLVLGKPKS